MTLDGTTRPRWADAIEAVLDARLRSATVVRGGDIAESSRVTLERDTVIFLKDYGDGYPGIAEAEAEGLAWLREARALRLPEVVAVGNGWLALEWIESAPPARDFHERLGRGLARLHAKGARHYGFPSANWIGRLPQRNDPAEDWAAFYGDARLRPLRLLAEREGPLPPELAIRLDRLIDELPERVGPAATPARLHGDLWSGNLITDERGHPCLIDPAVYGGDREVDLAMMKLFGGFDRRAFRAYEEAIPLPTGSESRIPLYQIYPLLVHVCLFGAGYLSPLERAVDAALAEDR
jgi:fructosamine-3-kinase